MYGDRASIVMAGVRSERLPVELRVEDRNRKGSPPMIASVNGKPWRAARNHRLGTATTPNHVRSVPC